MDTSCVLQFKNLLIYTRLDLQFYLLFRHSKTEITRYWEYRYVLSLIGSPGDRQMLLILSGNSY